MSKISDNYSLSLFGTTDSDIFKKPVQATQMIIQNDAMTGQQLLAWNILVKNAKEQKNLWKQNNIQIKDSEKIYRISRKELMKRMDYKSTNRGPFKKALIEMQNLKASWDVLGSDTTNKWASCVLLPFVQCDEEYVTYAFVNLIEPMLFESAIYSKLDLVIQKNLKLDASRKLYDWLNRYRTNPSHLSNKSAWQFWKTVIHGKDENSYTKEYKIFKRDKLKPAIKEINEISDLIIELIEDKDGTRSVQYLQFKVFEKPKFSTESEEKLISASPKIDIGIELGKLNISSYFKKKIINSFSEQIILSNVKYTLDRIAASPGKILNHGAYLVAACENNYANAGIETVNVIKKKLDSKEKTLQIMEAIQTIRKEQAERMFMEYSLTEQVELTEHYNDQCKLIEERIPDEASKRQARHLVPFYTWLARQTWGDPTPQEIIEYTLKNY